MVHSCREKGLLVASRLALSELVTKRPIDNFNANRWVECIQSTILGCALRETHAACLISVQQTTGRVERGITKKAVRIHD